VRKGELRLKATARQKKKEVIQSRPHVAKQAKRVKEKKVTKCRSTSARFTQAMRRHRRGLSTWGKLKSRSLKLRRVEEAETKSVRKNTPFTNSQRVIRESNNKNRKGREMGCLSFAWGEEGHNQKPGRERGKNMSNLERRENDYKRRREIPLNVKKTSLIIQTT